MPTSPLSCGDALSFCLFVLWSFPMIGALYLPWLIWVLKITSPYLLPVAISSFCSLKEGREQEPCDFQDLEESTLLTFHPSAGKSRRGPHLRESLNKGKIFGQKKIFLSLNLPQESIRKKVFFADGMFQKIRRGCWRFVQEPMVYIDCTILCLRMIYSFSMMDTNLNNYQ